MNIGDKGVKRKIERVRNLRVGMKDREMEGTEGLRLGRK